MGTERKFRKEQSQPSYMESAYYRLDENTENLIELTALLKNALHIGAFEGHDGQYNLGPFTIVSTPCDILATRDGWTVAASRAGDRLGGILAEYMTMIIQTEKGNITDHRVKDMSLVNNNNDDEEDSVELQSYEGSEGDEVWELAVAPYWIPTIEKLETAVLDDMARREEGESSTLPILTIEQVEKINRGEINLNGIHCSSLYFKGYHFGLWEPEHFTISYNGHILYAKDMSQGMKEKLMTIRNFSRMCKPDDCKCYGGEL